MVMNRKMNVAMNSAITAWLQEWCKGKRQLVSLS